MLYLPVHWGDLIEQIKKASVIHTWINGSHVDKWLSLPVSQLEKCVTLIEKWVTLRNMAKTR